MQNTWKCAHEDCGKEFKAGDWECFPGQKHTVKEKTYYIKDAPHDPSGTSLRKSRTTVHNIPPERHSVDKQSGETRTVPGGWVEFIRGQFTTSDPEQQWWLDKSGFDRVTREEWEHVYLSQLEKNALAESRVSAREAEANRKLKEANELLAQVKQQKGARV